jgi:hypothetical protein
MTLHDLCRRIPPACTTGALSEQRVSDHFRDGGTTAKLCHCPGTFPGRPSRSTPRMPGNSASIRVVSSWKPANSAAPVMLGDFCPARGSQPGAQAGRHALNGLEDVGSGSCEEHEFLINALTIRGYVILLLFLIVLLILFIIVIFILIFIRVVLRPSKTGRIRALCNSLSLPGLKSRQRLRTNRSTDRGQLSRCRRPAERRRKLGAHFGHLTQNITRFPVYANGPARFLIEFGQNNLPR